MSHAPSIHLALGAFDGGTSATAPSYIPPAPPPAKPMAASG